MNATTEQKVMVRNQKHLDNCIMQRFNTICVLQRMLDELETTERIEHFERDLFDALTTILPENSGFVGSLSYCASLDQIEYLYTNNLIEVLKFYLQQTIIAVCCWNYQIDSSDQADNNDISELLTVLFSRW